MSLAQEYANLERELASLRDQINRQNTTIHSLTSLLHKSPAPQQQFQTVSIKDDDWRRSLLFINSNPNSESKKCLQKISTLEAVNSFLVDRCGLPPNAVKSVQRSANSRYCVELDSEENVLRVLKVVESWRDAQGRLPWSTKIARNWPPEQKDRRQKAFYEAAAKGSGHYVDEIDLLVKQGKSSPHHTNISTISNNSWRNSILLTAKGSAVQPLTLIDFFCKHGRLNKSDIVATGASNGAGAGLKVDLKSEESVLQALGNINEERKRGEKLPFSAQRCWPFELRGKRYKAITELMQHKTGYYLDEVDLQVKPCQQSTLEVTKGFSIRSNTILFNFAKSNLVHSGNAQTKFAELVIKFGVSIDTILSVNCMPVPKILIATFRDEESASTVLKTFQEKKIRDELSPEFKFCRIYFNLPKHLQLKRNELFREVNNKKMSFGIRNLYVDEYDLTIKERPAGLSLSPATSAYTLNEPSIMYSEKGEEEYKKRPFKIFFTDSKYARMSFFDLAEELFGPDASDIQLEGDVPGGYSLSLNPACQKSLEELLEGLPSNVYFRW